MIGNLHGNSEQSVGENDQHPITLTKGPESQEIDPDRGSTESLQERLKMAFEVQKLTIEAVAQCLEKKHESVEASKTAVKNVTEMFYSHGDQEDPTNQPLSADFREKCCDDSIFGKPIRLGLYKELLAVKEAQRPNLILRKMGFVGVVGCAERIKINQAWRRMLKTM